MTAPATAAATEASTVTAWSARGSRSPATIPTRAAAPKASHPIHGRRRAAGATSAPSPRQTTTIVVTRTGLSAVPSESMPVRTSEPGAWSMISPPTEPTSDCPGLPVPDTSSPTPSATPAAASPASRARLTEPVRWAVEVEVTTPSNTGDGRSESPGGGISGGISTGRCPTDRSVG